MLYLWKIKWFPWNLLHKQKSNIEKVSKEKDPKKPKDFLGKLLDGQRKNIEKVSKDKDWNEKTFRDHSSGFDNIE